MRLGPEVPVNGSADRCAPVTGVRARTRVHVLGTPRIWPRNTSYSCNTSYHNVASGAPTMPAGRNSPRVARFRIIPRSPRLPLSYLLSIRVSLFATSTAYPLSSSPGALRGPPVGLMASLPLPFGLPRGKVTPSTACSSRATSCQPFLSSPLLLPLSPSVPPFQAYVLSQSHKWNSFLVP